MPFSATGAVVSSISACLVIDSALRPQSKLLFMLCSMKNHASGLCQAQAA